MFNFSVVPSLSLLFVFHKDALFHKKKGHKNIFHYLVPKEPTCTKFQRCLISRYAKEAAMYLKCFGCFKWGEKGFFTYSTCQINKWWEATKVIEQYPTTHKSKIHILN